VCGLDIEIREKTRCYSISRGLSLSRFERDRVCVCVWAWVLVWVRVFASCVLLPVGCYQSRDSSVGVGVGWVLSVGVGVGVGMSCGIPPVASGRIRFLDWGFLLLLMHLCNKMDMVF